MVQATRLDRTIRLAATCKITVETVGDLLLRRQGRCVLKDDCSDGESGAICLDVAMQVIYWKGGSTPSPNAETSYSARRR